MTNSPRPIFTREGISPRSHWILEEVKDLNADALNARCYKCSAVLSWGQWLNSSDSTVRVPCHTCENKLYAEFCSGDITRELWGQVQDPEYFDRVWYHASQKKNWAKEIRQANRGELLVHAGSKLSALSRADDIFTDTPSDEPIYLHSFRLRSSQSFSRIVLDDMMDDWQIELNDPERMSVCPVKDADPALSEDYPRPPLWFSLDQKMRGVSYYNRYELPGDISILFHGKLVQLNTVETIELKR